MDWALNKVQNIYIYIVLSIEESAIHLGKQHVYKQPQYKVESHVSLKKIDEDLERILRWQDLILAGDGRQELMDK